MPTTQTVWVTRARTTKRHVVGLLQALEAADALDYTEVRIMTLDEEQAVKLPDGTLITEDNLPPEGVFFVADE